MRAFISLSQKLQRFDSKICKQTYQFLFTTNSYLKNSRLSTCFEVKYCVFMHFLAVLKRPFRVWTLCIFLPSRISHYYSKKVYLIQQKIYFIFGFNTERYARYGAEFLYYAYCVDDKPSVQTEQRRGTGTFQYISNYHARNTILSL